MRNDFQLDRKYVLVSGGTSGIGAKCCALISDYGGIPICLGRDEQKLYDLQKTIPSMIPIHIDLQILDSIENSLAEKLQGIKVDGLVHSAGIELTRPIRNIGHDDLTRVFSINLLSGILLAKMLSKKSIVPEKGSSFIFIASIMSIVGEAGKTG